MGKSAVETKNLKQRMRESKALAKVKQARKRNKRLKRSTNAFIDAALRGEGYHAKEDGDLSDLEDFIVCKPGRDYDRVLAKRVPKASHAFAGEGSGSESRRRGGKNATLAEPQD